MKKNTLMISAAMFAFAVTGGIASAQNAGGGAARGGDAPAASGAASGGAAPSAKGAGADLNGSAGAGAAAESNSGAKAGVTAQENTGAKTNAREAQDNKAGNAPNSRADSENKGGMKNDKAATDADRNNKSNTASDSKSNAEGKTTGNAATAAKAAPPAEKRTQISSAIKQEKVTAVTNVNFNVSVGTRIPGSVHFYPVPAPVVAIYPEWRGYQFILVGSRYIIVEPETHEIVYIIES